MADIRIIEYDEIDSTQEEAKRLVRGGGSLYGTVITAKRQTAGKGRRGKSFFSRGEDCIYASFILPPSILTDPGDPSVDFITKTAGAVVCAAIEKSTLYKPYIKGVNDVFIDGRKVCGILAEGIPEAVILGIGVNINLEEEDFPEELREIAGSLYLSEEGRAQFFSDLVEMVSGAF